MSSVLTVNARVTFRSKFSHYQKHLLVYPKHTSINCFGGAGTKFKWLSEAKPILDCVDGVNGILSYRGKFHCD